MTGTAIEALVDQLAAMVAVRLQTRLSPESPQQVGRLLTVKQAAVYLGRSEQAVQHLIHKRQIAVVKKGRRVHLDKIDLDRWIDAGKQ